MGNIKVKKIQIPNSLITTPKMQNELYLYAILKTLSFGNKVSIQVKKLMESLKWKDNRTLKKYLKSLIELNLIECLNLDRFSNFQPLELNIKSIRGHKFTQVDIHSVNKVKERMCQCNFIENKTEVTNDMKEKSMMLFFYYEKNYNADLGYAFTSYTKITKETGINPKEIVIINNNFKKNGLVYIMSGKFYKDEETNLTQREVNRYKPNCLR